MKRILVAWVIAVSGLAALLLLSAGCDDKAAKAPPPAPVVDVAAVVQKDVDMVPNLSRQNLACIETGKNFMLKKGYIKNDFDVQKWAAPEFLERAARELIEEQWKKKSGEKLPEGTLLRLG